MVTKKIMGLPGTGKTTALLNTIDELLQDGTVDRISDFCISTFRKEMAAELKERLQKKHDCSKEDLLNVGTIHGICRRIAGIDLGSIIQNTDLKQFAELSGFDYTPSNNGEVLDPADVTNAQSGNMFLDVYSWMQNTRKTVDDISEYPNYWRIDRGIDIRAYIDDYEKFKQERSKYDFADMLNEVDEQHLSPAASILIVDEFQDLTPKQYSIFKQWSENAEHTYIAGDPYQCIYPFWGATPDFFHEVNGTLEILPESRRFGSTVWGHAKEILETHGYDDIPRINPIGESNKIRNIYRDEYLDDILPHFTSDTFHLVRCHYMAYNIAQRLIDTGIPFLGDYGWNDWQILVNNSLLELKQKGYINKFGLLKLIEIHPDNLFNKNSDTINKQIAERQKIIYTLEDIKRFIAPLSNYSSENFITSIAGDAPLCFADISESVKTRIANVLEKSKRPINNITVFLGTIHSVKGREAANVFVWNEINTRINKSLFDSEQAKDEARVWFVAASRAKRNLLWVDAGTRYVFGGM